MKISRLLVAGLVTSLTLGGCSKNESGSATGPEPGATGEKFTVAFVTNNASDFWTIARKGCEKADEELANVEVQFKLPDGTAADQKRVLDDLVVNGVQGIAVSPVDPANQTEMLNEIAKKAVLVTQDSDAPESDRICYIGTDNVAAGRQAGELIKEALPDGGKIMVFVGMIDALNAKQRYQGIQEALKGSNVEILDVRTDDTDRARAKSNVADTLVKHPDVACLVGLWSYNGPAILNAVKEAGKVGKVQIVCFDEEDDTLAGVKDGSIVATVVQQPYEFGYQAVKLMAKVLGGDKSSVPADKLQIVPTLVIKKDDVDAFKTKLDGLRGR